MIPLFNIQTEFSFRKTFAPIKRVVDRLSEIDCPAAAIADTTTFGHIQFQQLALDAGITPMFARQLFVNDVPVIGISMCGVDALYSMNEKISVAEMRKDGVLFICERPPEFIVTAVRNMIDAWLITPRSTFAARLILNSGVPYVVGSANSFAYPDDFDTFLAISNDERPSPQHIMGFDELCKWFGDDVVDESSNTELFERIKPHQIPDAENLQVVANLDTMIEQGISARGIEMTEEYKARLEREMFVIREKGFESYFCLVADLVLWAKTKMLVGPGRGSAAGSLVCYLLGITELDPIKHGLLFERFIDLNRTDLPDIDIDFQHDRRELIFDYLRSRYGAKSVARLGSVNRLKPKSLMLTVAKSIGITDSLMFDFRDTIREYPPGDHRYGHSVELALQSEHEMVSEYPDIQFIAAAENHAWHAGQHAAGVLVANKPIHNFASVVDGVAQIDKYGAEKINLMKIDALGLTTLTILANALPGFSYSQVDPNDSCILQIFNERKFSGIFQFEGAALRQFAEKIKFESFDQIDHLTALARPGPMDSGAAERYMNVATGAAKKTFLHESLRSILAVTNGMILYQEQVMQIAREIGGFDWPTVIELRKLIGKSQGGEAIAKLQDQFVAGAAKNDVDKKSAAAIWHEIESFGRYGMNKSHTRAYALISVWCAYAKSVAPVRFAIAVLNATDDDQKQIAILREMATEGIRFVPFDIHRSGVSWTAGDDEIIGGFTNIVGIGPVKAAQLIERRNNDMLTETDRKLFQSAKYKIESANEAHTKFGDWYDNPSAHGVRGKIIEFADFQSGRADDGVIIAKLEKLEHRDENEPDRVKRRGYQLRHATKFFNLRMVDDTVTKPVLVRVGSKLVAKIDTKEIENSKRGDWFMIRGRWLKKFSMLSVDKIRKLQ